MLKFMNMKEQHNARPDVAYAVAHAAPIWVLGLLLLGGLIVLLGWSNSFPIETSAVAIVSIAFVVAAAFETMVRDLRRDSELCAETYRRMTHCCDARGGVGGRGMRVAHVALQAYVSASMRQRAHLRSTSLSADLDGPFHKRRPKGHRSQ